MDQSENLIDYHEAAPILGLTEGTLRSLVSRSQIPRVRLSDRIVRFSRRSLQEWIASHSVTGGGKAVSRG